MSWVSQGRQEHGWFGHGVSGARTGPESAAGRAELRARAFGTVELAADALTGSSSMTAFALRRHADAIRDLVPVWAADANLDPDSFRRRFFGDETDPVDAWGLQRTVLAVMHADSLGGLKEAGVQLAAAVKSTGMAKFSALLQTAQSRLLAPSPPAVLSQGGPAAQSLADVRRSAGELKHSGRDDGVGPYSPDKEGWHDYTQGPDLVCVIEQHCSNEEMADQLARFAVPGQDPSKPVETGHIYPVHAPLTGVVVGRILTIIKDHGLTITNITIPGHIFYDGKVTRQAIRNRNGSWQITTRGVGNNIIPGMAQVNKSSGP